MYPVNEERVKEVLSSVPNSVTRNLVQMAVATARMRFIRGDDEDQQTWTAKLPAAPFDVAFFAQVVAEAFRNEEVLRAIVNGASIAEATGWDV